jgi:hypothetical protein
VLKAETSVKQFISPNNDGVQDVWTLPVSMTDERFITSYRVAVFDLGKSLVRSQRSAVSVSIRGALSETVRGFELAANGCTLDGSLILSQPLPHCVSVGCADSESIVCPEPPALLRPDDCSIGVAVCEPFGVCIVVRVGERVGLAVGDGVRERVGVVVRVLELVAVAHADFVLVVVAVAQLLFERELVGERVHERERVCVVEREPVTVLEPVRERLRVVVRVC